MTLQESKLLRDKILRGLELSRAKLIKYKKARNLDVVVSQNGKIVRVKAKDL